MDGSYHEGFEMPNQTVLEQRMDAMADELREVRGALSEVAQALAKLSVLEERNLMTSQAIDKIAQRQDKLEEKIANIGLEQVKFESNAKGMASGMKFMWGAVGGSVIYVGNELVKHLTH